MRTILTAHMMSGVSGMIEFIIGWFCAGMFRTIQRTMWGDSEIAAARADEREQAAQRATLAAQAEYGDWKDGDKLAPWDLAIINAIRGEDNGHE